MKGLQRNLFDVEATRRQPSRRTQIRTFKQNHGIETHDAGAKQPGRWIALHWPSLKESTHYNPVEHPDLACAIGHLAGLLEESGILVTGDTEVEAIRNLCRNLKMECPL